MILFPILLTNSVTGQITNYNNLTAQNLHDSLLHYRISDKEKALFFAKLCTEKAKVEKNIKIEGLVIESYAILNLYEKNIDQALFEAERLMAFAKKNEHIELLIRAHLLAGDLQVNIPNTGKSMDYYNSALVIAEKNNEEVLRGITLSKLANLLELSGDYTKAISLFKKNMTFYSNKEIDSSYTAEIKTKNILRSLIYLSSSYQKIKQIDSAKYYHNKLKLTALESDSCDLYLVYYNQAEISFLEEDYKEAKSNFKKTLEYCPPESPLFWLNHAYRLGKVEHGMGNFSIAIEILEDGLTNYQVTPEEEGYMHDYYQIIADCYKENGNFEKAHFYFEKYLNTKNEFSKIQDDVSTSIRAQELADYKSELEELEKAKQNQTDFLNYLFLGASVVILILLLLLLRFYRLRKNDETKFKALMSRLNANEQNHNEQAIVNVKDALPEEKTNNEISNEIKLQIIEGLKQLEINEYFLSKDCNSYNVAKKIKTNTTYLSKVINMEFEKNFNTYINDLRINYAILRLKNDPQFRAFSIQAIAEELGYKSGDSFAKYFKQHTQLNPSFYIKQLNSL